MGRFLLSVDLKEREKKSRIILLSGASDVESEQKPYEIITHGHFSESDSLKVAEEPTPYGKHE